MNNSLTKILFGCIGEYISLKVQNELEDTKQKKEEIKEDKKILKKKGRNKGGKEVRKKELNFTDKIKLMEGDAQKEVLETGKIDDNNNMKKRFKERLKHCK